MYVRSALALFLFAVFVSSAQAGNLIGNGAFETAGPSGWTQGRWGNNVADFAYPVPGISGHGARVTLSNRVTGDAKWAHTPVAVTPGRTYRYQDSYTATVSHYVTLEYELTNGSRSYLDIATPPAASSWSPVSRTFTVPPNVAKVRVFHLINQNGALTIDNATLEDVTPVSGNLVPNPSLENETNGLPTSWATGRWGTHTANFTYPVAGFGSAKAAQVTITSHVSGDAKWYFTPVPVDPGTVLTFSDRYKATVPTQGTAQFTHANGSVSYLNLGNVPAASDWATYTKTFTVPAGVVSVTIFHVLKSVGSLTIDAYELSEATGDPTLFDQGYVSLTFDDGYLAAYQNALPILDEAGFVSDQFIITERLSNNFPGYVKPAHVLDMQARGHVIGAHTRTHPNLTTLTSSQARAEIEGSRNDLLALGAAPVDYFAYPVGAYNAQIQQMVRDAGMQGARSSDGGLNDKSTDPYALRRFKIDNTTTFAQMKSAIDAAREQKRWVILLFHQVDTSGATYAVTPALFAQVVEYVKSKNITPITIGEGVRMMND